jgi:hypothetical protein
VIKNLVEARLKYQMLRDVPGASAQDAVCFLATALSPLLTPGAGPEAALRRGDVAREATAAQRITDRHARYPELRDMHLDGGGVVPSVASSDHELGG